MTGGVPTGFADWQVLIAIAFFGGLAANIMRLLERRNAPPGRKNPIDIWYIAQFVILPIIGSGIAFIYLWDQTPLTGWLSFQVGASAPLIIKQIASAVPTELAKG